MTVPSNMLVPGVYFAIDNSQAVTGASVAPFRTVIIGQKLTAGTVAAETLVPVYGVSDAEKKFGVGSQLAEMFEYWFSGNTVHEVFAVALDDNAGGTAATKTLTVTASSVKAGTLFLYVNDRQIQIGVNTADTANDIATAIANAVNAYPEIPVAAGASTNVVTLTARNKGTLGNKIVARFNWEITEEYPEGVSVAVAAGVTGATDPDIGDAIAAIPDEIYGLFLSPYADATSLSTVETELDRRFGDTAQLEGHYITGMSGSAGTINAVTSARNNEHVSIVACGNDPLTPAYLMAVGVGAQVAKEADADPARPFQTLAVVACTGDQPTNRYNLTEQQSLLSNGAATVIVDAGGVVRIQRIVTTYKTNAQGSPDPSYKDANTLFTASYFRMSARARITSKYARHKLAADGTQFGAGQSIVTPKIIRSEFIDLFRSWELLGLAENIDQFIDDLVVVRNVDNGGSDPNRLDVILPPDLVNQFRVMGGSIQFRL